MYNKYLWAGIEKARRLAWLWYAATYGSMEPYVSSARGKRKDNSGRWELVSKVPEECCLLSSLQKASSSPAWAHFCLFGQLWELMVQPFVDDKGWCSVSLLKLLLSWGGLSWQSRKAGIWVKGQDGVGVGVVAGSGLAEGAWRERHREQSHWFNNEWQGIPEYGDLSQTTLWWLRELF